MASRLEPMPWRQQFPVALTAASLRAPRAPSLPPPSRQVRDRELCISFLHHMAVQRQVRNPFESAGERAGSGGRVRGG